VLEWMGATRCSEYLIEEFEYDLIESEKLHRREKNILLFKYQPLSYYQLFGDFIPHLSYLDLIFNEGPGGSQKLEQKIR
jgi:hypothetical protein